MPLSTTNELKNLNQQFYDWKKKYSNKPYPKKFWLQAIDLATAHGVKTVAKSIGFPEPYLQSKIEKQSVSTETKTHFVELQVQNQSPLFPSNQEVKLHLKQANGKSAEVSFCGNVSQIFPVLSDFIKGE